MECPERCGLKERKDERYKKQETLDLFYILDKIQCNEVSEALIKSDTKRIDYQLTTNNK